MGFNYFCFGNVHPCWMDNGTIKYRLRSGKVISHATGLEDLNIPEQTNIFLSDRIMWILYNDGLEYVGRRDGSISVYRVSDDVLFGLNSWAAPLFPETQICGFTVGDFGRAECHLDRRDMQTVYVAGVYMEGLLLKPANVNLTIEAVRSSSAVTHKATQIYNSGGEILDISEWFVQEKIRRRDCPCYV